MADPTIALWVDVLRLCNRYTNAPSEMTELVSSTAQLVTVNYRLALARPELHAELQQKATDAVLSLAETIIKIAPFEARDELINEFTRLHERLHQEYHRVAPGERIH